MTPLAKAMAKPYPSPAVVERETQAALKALNGFPAQLEKGTWNRPAITRLRQKLIAHYRGMKSSNWDELEQLALGLKALQAADRAMRKSELDEDKKRAAALNRLLQLLAFPLDRNSPLGFRKGNDFDKDLNAIFDALTR